MAETKQNLPFRPLEVRGHGIWDPERKTFYPFKAKHFSGFGTKTSIVLPAKQNISYFVKTSTISCISNGDNEFASVYTHGTINGANADFNTVYAPITTAASGVNHANVVCSDVCLLCDTNKSIQVVSTGSYYFCVDLIYAEIPDDIPGQ